MLLSLTSLKLSVTTCTFLFGCTSRLPTIPVRDGRYADAIPTHVANVHIIIMHATTRRFFRYTLALWWDTPLVLVVVVFPPLAFVSSSSKSSKSSMPSSKSSSFFFSREKDDVNDDDDDFLASSKLWCSSCRRDVLEANPAKHGCDERPSLGNLGISHVGLYVSVAVLYPRARGKKPPIVDAHVRRGRYASTVWMPRIGFGFWKRKRDISEMIP